MNKALPLAALTALFLAAFSSAARADRFELKIGSGHSKGAAPYVTAISDFFVVEVMRRVKAETAHEVAFKETYGGETVKVQTVLEGVQEGIIDIGGFCVCFEPEKLFLHNFPYYEPFGPAKTSEAITAARIVYDQNPWLSEVLVQEYGQRLLGLGAWDNYHLGTTHEWRRLQQLKGVRIAGVRPNLPWLEYLGATPVQSDLQEAYEKLKSGFYDGWLMTPAGYNGFKLYDPSPYYTLISFGAMPVNMLTINSKTLASLPPEIRSILIEVGREWEARNGPAMDRSQEIGLQRLRENGARIRQLPSETRKEWALSLSAFALEKAMQAEALKLPGIAVMRAYLEAAEAQGHFWPVRYEFDEAGG